MCIVYSIFVIILCFNLLLLKKKNFKTIWLNVMCAFYIIIAFIWKFYYCVFLVKLIANSNNMGMYIK